MYKIESECEEDPMKKINQCIATRTRYRFKAIFTKLLIIRAPFVHCCIAVYIFRYRYYTKENTAKKLNIK